VLVTDHRCHVDNTTASYSGGCILTSRPKNWLSWLFLGFTQFFFWQISRWCIEVCNWSSSFHVHTVHHRAVYYKLIYSQRRSTFTCRSSKSLLCQRVQMYLDERTTFHKCFTFRRAVSASSIENCDIIIIGSSYCETLVVFMLIAQCLGTGVDICRSVRL